tara:strand:+ start:276 stop:449 length:174 start_codon:yes stop_codon:yes gene_type:complete
MNNKLILELVDKEISNIWEQVSSCDIKPNVATLKLEWLNLDKRLRELQKLRMEMLNK